MPTSASVIALADGLPPTPHAVHSR
jgi:hypothetical protein